MLQRSPTFVMSVQKGMPMMGALPSDGRRSKLNHAVGGLYNEQADTDESDRIAESNPKLVAKLFHKRIIPKLAEADSDLLAGLEKAGFKTWAGPEDSGFLMSQSLCRGQPDEILPS